MKRIGRVDIRRRPFLGAALKVGRGQLKKPIPDPEPGLLVEAPGVSARLDAGQTPVPSRSPY